MNKVIVIFGAGTGLSASVARLYGKQGYLVALVARNKEKLQLLSDDMSSNHIKSFTFIADLSKSEQVKMVISEIYDSLGHIDILYYAPNPRDTFIPANELTSELLIPKINLYLFGLINVIQEILPIFRKNNAGIILSAIGGSALEGFPYMSGLGPVMAASRNYLQALYKELNEENIHIGLLTISAQIINSENYKLTYQESSPFPSVHPDALAKMLRDIADDVTKLEVLYP
ncbi:SDR family NAD(P)-dependent oxidoreductase [Acinetobacter equi]|uniref:Short-chain dehydrogenase n=1 Tax=Acinetobacter equi TaxID=1324350 RepID=A0A0N9VY14_9GAMM|nr:SDR family NAD(P)-dependent oxidoreductase [Acinetobacter equi]ALH96280.1 hypothetical protein AOY20_12445 [Acinetobacter equi]